MVVFASFSVLPRKVRAMEPEPEIAMVQSRPKQEEASPSKAFLLETRTAVKASDVLEQETKSDKTLASPGSGQELISVGDSLAIDSLAIRSPSVTARVGRSTGSETSAARSIAAQSRGASGTSGPGRQSGRGTSGSFGSGGGGPNQRALASANSTVLGSHGLRNLATKFSDCCCGPESLVCGGSRKSHFNTSTVTEKREEWNAAIAEGVKPEHKPKTLEKNLSHHDKGIFSSSDTETAPLYVFAHEDRDRVLDHVQYLAGTEPGSSGATTYDPKQIIFEKTIPKGKYVKAFTFIDNYTERAPSARDNYNHNLNYAALKDEEGRVPVEGLVNPETSPNHLSTGHWKSSTHADLYMRKGQKKAGNWACVGAISHHTGVAEEPTNTGKLKRDATYKR